VRINSPKCSFVRVARWFVYTSFVIENKNSQQYVLLNIEMSRIKFWVFTFWIFTFWQNRKVERNFLEPGLLAFRSISILQQTSSWKQVGKLDRRHRLHLTLNGFTENANMILTHAVHQVWRLQLSLSCTVLLYSAIFWSATDFLRKAFVLILTLGKLQNVFDNLSLTKILILSFSFTVFVIKSRGIPGNQSYELVWTHW